jgi:molybdopterin adenylyltransferase
MPKIIINAVNNKCHHKKIIVAENTQNNAVFPIEQTIRDVAGNKNCNLILTTGGTGPTTLDVTPEATHAVCERIFDGFAEQMRTVSLRTVPTAILSRQTAGTRGKSLIINLPGKPDAIAVCLGAVFLAVPKCLELLDNSNIQIDLDFVEKDFS